MTKSHAVCCSRFKLGFGWIVQASNQNIISYPCSLSVSSLRSLYIHYVRSSKFKLEWKVSGSVSIVRGDRLIRPTVLWQHSHDFEWRLQIFWISSYVVYLQWPEQWYSWKYLMTWKSWWMGFPLTSKCNIRKHVLFVEDHGRLIPWRKINTQVPVQAWERLHQNYSPFHIPNHIEGFVWITLNTWGYLQCVYQYVGGSAMALFA